MAKNDRIRTADILLLRKLFLAWARVIGYDLRMKKSPEFQEFARRLRILRNPKSRRLMAADIGVTEARYYAWETCQSHPNLDDLIAISKCFGVSADYLLGLSDSPHGVGIAATNSSVISGSPNGSISACRDCPHIAAMNGTIAALSQTIAALSTGKK